MTRLFNRGNAAARNRETIRRNIMARANLLSALQLLRAFRTSRQLRFRLSAENKELEKQKNKLIRNAFRRAGYASVLPFDRNKMISKLSYVEMDARRILRAANRARENAKRKHENGTYRTAHTPSLRVNYGRPNNTGRPGVLVLSPGN